MEIFIDQELHDICREIINQNRTLEEWNSIESSDMFQTKHYCGGYDADESAFCFSYNDKEAKEYWFQLTLQKIEEILEGKLTKINLRPAEF